MVTQNCDVGKKYLCWINEQERILSFHFEEGFVEKEFSNHSDFRDYYYQLTLCGYRVQ